MAMTKAERELAVVIGPRVKMEVLYVRGHESNEVWFPWPGFVTCQACKVEITEREKAYRIGIKDPVSGPRDAWVCVNTEACEARIAGREPPKLPDPPKVPKSKEPTRDDKGRPLAGGFSKGGFSKGH